ncbi:MAG: amidotransferase, partial [Spirochaetes bacterium RBG_16_49_21]
MKIHYLQHVPFEGPAHLSAASQKLRAELSYSRLFSGEKVPDPASFDLLVILGGPMGVYDEREYPWLVEEKNFIAQTLASGKRVIGICLGAQLLASLLGARVYRNSYKEIGWFPVTRSDDARSSAMGNILPDLFPAFHWHGDTFDLPAGALRLAESEACVNQGFIYEDRALGLQFHLESTAESIRQLYDNCGDELDGSRFVRTGEEILKTDHISGCNLLFERIVSE